jgi:ABC-type multidrug transport system ATPase subunit
MSTFFSRSKTAAILGVIPYFGGYFISMAIKPSSTRTAKLLACLHPSAAFTLAMSAFTEYEDAGQGITRLTAATSATGNFAFADAVGMMLFDVLLYSALFWYFDKVWPSEFGTRLPPYFFLTPSYWRSILPRVGPGGPVRTAVVDVEAALAQELTLDVERVPDTLAQQIRDGSCVYIRGLCKSFKTNTGVKHAVDNLNLTMYSGQITALLGHNGAGKSTTIGILSGLTAASSGTALINGRDVSRDMAAIRHSLGVCPQHDVLFPDLTVEEHLTLFAAFKGVPAREIPSEVESMIREVGLTEKRKVASKNLSGGMKRKLSVGIAFIGGCVHWVVGVLGVRVCVCVVYDWKKGGGGGVSGHDLDWDGFYRIGIDSDFFFFAHTHSHTTPHRSKTVFLDEPTSGMDPFSRRYTWNVIRKNREGRTIILTTHFLEEADLLGDRIAIMNKCVPACVCGVGVSGQEERRARAWAPSRCAAYTTNHPILPPPPPQHTTHTAGASSVPAARRSSSRTTSAWATTSPSRRPRRPTPTASRPSCASASPRPASSAASAPRLPSSSRAPPRGRSRTRSRRWTPTRRAWAWRRTACRSRRWRRCSFA